MRSPGWTIARPMKPLVEPTVAGVSIARRSPPRLRLGSVSLRSTMHGCCLFMVDTSGGGRDVGRAGCGRRGARRGGPSGTRRAAVGDGHHVGVRQEAVEVAPRLEGALDTDRGTVEETLQLRCLPRPLEAAG